MPVANSAASVEFVGQSDEDVIREVLDGQTAKFELLMRRYNERIYRTTRAIVRNEEEVEDVMQQAYVNAFVHLHHFNGSARFSTWLTRIAINESLAHIKRQGRLCALDDTLMLRAPDTLRIWEDPERQAIAIELRRHLDTAIDRLPDGAREVFVLRAVEGLSTAEVAACLGVSDDVVKTRLLRARASLRRVLIARSGVSASDAFRFYRPRCDRIVAAVLARILH
jgi:RNA polymerase sigma-70 factor (ECF subfamily)